MWAAASNDFNGADGIGAGISFLGGFLMLFGSRWGHGCTSGHGISGCALLTIEYVVLFVYFFIYWGGGGHADGGTLIREG